MGYFRWIVGRIALNGENVVWVSGGLGVKSQKIEKNALNFKAMAQWTLARCRLCPSTGDSVLSPVRVALIARFIASYEFDVRDFLAQEIIEQALGGKKSLLAYPCMATLICLAMGVQELSGIDEMIEAMNTTNLGLIRDIANPLDKKERNRADMLAEMYRQSGQTETTDTIKKDFQTETSLTLDAAGAYRASPLMHSVPPRSKGMPSRFNMISQAMWTKLMTRLITLEAKV